MDMVTERMFQDALLLGDAALQASDQCKVEYIGQSEAEPHRMSVLAPGPARRELIRTVMALYETDGDVIRDTLNELPTIVDVVLPLASRMTTSMCTAKILRLQSTCGSCDHLQRS